MPLIDVLNRLPLPLYAVVDGALMEDAQSSFHGADLVFSPLYNGVLERDGIHLVTLEDRADTHRLLELFDDFVPAVFWSWNGDGASLQRHLRGLGKVEVPKSGTNPIDPEFEAVIFRHADPNSLIAVLPVLTDAQRASFFGGAHGIVFEHRDRRGRKEIVRAPRDGRLLRGGLAEPIG